MPQSINNIQHLILCITAEILCIFGVLINAFIVAVNLIDWLKRKVATHIDQIITILGMTRICSQVASFLSIFYGVFFYNQNSFLRLYIIESVDYFFNHSSFWLMSLLSIVYCLKISNFHHVFVLRLKIIISQKVVHLIIASKCFSFCYILLICCVELIEDTEYTAHNMTTDSVTNLQRSVAVLLMSLLSNFVPFVLYCISSALVIASVSFHIHQMKLNKTPTSNLDTYYNVIKFLTLSWMYYILDATIHVVVIYSHNFHSLDMIWVHITIESFSNLHSMYLIYKTNKLKDSFCRIFQHGTNCLLNRQIKDLTLGNHVEIIME
ncbi:hypothetical protein GDO78_022468 [Eleutherodactylus coqui]|uniref:Taste receptor type 2 n=1 Tax=Eleutherodactylus coqui TaxID=57060 RepID=A0A8J6EG52_ELECQ|nr:hypothetical protein GDO78_022468 [Eleutherodactylus coqui]